MSEAGTLRIQVRLFGTVRRFSMPETPGLWQGTVNRGSTIRDVLRIMGIEEREVSSATLNGVLCPFDEKVADGATVVLVTPMGGG